MQDNFFFLFFYFSHRSQTVRRGGGGLPQEAPFLYLLHSMRTIQFFLCTDS